MNININKVKIIVTVPSELSFYILTNSKFTKKTNLIKFLLKHS